MRKKLQLPISFETFRPVGFMPTARYDLNDDGYIDFVSSGNGKKLEIHIGGPEGPFERRPVSLGRNLGKLPTAGKNAE